MSGIEIALAIAGLTLGPGGLAALAVKITLNGTAKRVERIETKVDGIAEDVVGVRERVARLEGARE